MMNWPYALPPDSEQCWQWSPTGLHDLTRVRRDFRAGVTALWPARSTRRADGLEDAVAALDELMSNALRHGRAPVVVEVGRTADGLLLLVGDAAADQSPLPTDDRDPSQGGMGLGIVARTCTSHGWMRRAGVKTVWALMPS